MSTVRAEDTQERKYRLGVSSPREADQAVAERRSAPREAQYRMAAFVWSGDGTTALACTVRDLSENGARVELDYLGFRPSRSPIVLARELTIHLCPQQKEIDCRLVWQDGRHFGVSFIGEPRPAERRFA